MTAQTPSPGCGRTQTAPPRHWEADVLLRDGRTAHIRPIRPDDADLLVEFYARVSDRSKYYRFFSPMPNLSDRDVARFTQVDHDHRVALVLLLQGQMIAVGRYDVVGDGEAEVAFLVEDQHHGRGIAQLLLEHLAQAARERGIERFIAEVLPDNQPDDPDLPRRRLPGRRAATRTACSRLEFPIDPTDTSIGVMRGREHRAEAASIERFFNPRSIAVIGAAAARTPSARCWCATWSATTSPAASTPSTPARRAVSGLPAYKSVGDIPDDVDVAIVAVPAEAVNDVVLDCAAKGVHGMIVISSGFAETGEEGRQRQRHLVGLSRSYGLRLIGPNCLGVINTDPAVSVNASLSSVMPPRGRAGFFCQSGALGSAILEKVQNRGLGLTTFVSAGNRADVSGNDLLQYWEEDDATEVVLLYLESIGNPRKFSRIARRVSLRKPIIAVRSGRTTQGVPMGHAVRRIVAPPEALDAMFRQAGIIQVDTLEEMFDVAQLLAHQPLPRGRRVAIVGNSDALGLLAADAAAAVGLLVTRSVTLGAEPSAEDFEDALDDAIDDPEVDSVIAVYIPPLNVSGEDVANVLAAVGEQSDKPLVSSFLGAEGVPELLRVPDVAGSAAGRGSVPSYPAVEAAVRALASVVEYAVWLRTPDGPAPDPAEVDTVAAPSGSSTRSSPPHPEGAQLDPRAGHRAAARLRHRAVGVRAGGQRQAGAGRRRAARLGRRAQGDRRGPARAARPRPRVAQHRHPDRDADAWESLERLVQRPRAGRLRGAEERRRPGCRSPSAAWRTRSSGPVVSFGISGPIIDLLADRSYRIPPLGERDVSAMVREVKSAPILFGYRGAEPVDVDAGRAADQPGRAAAERPAAAQRARAVARAGRRRAGLGADRLRPRRPGGRPALGPVRAPAARPPG